MLRFRFKFVAIVACVSLVGLAACGSSASKQVATTTPNAPTSSSAGPVVASSSVTSAPAASGVMVLSGAVTDSLSQAPTTTGKCRTVGKATTGAALFGGATGGYIVQITMPVGVTTFPTTGPESIVLTAAADTTKVWIITKVQATTKGSATLTGVHATIDADLEPSKSGSATGSVHLSGQFDC